MHSDHQAGHHEAPQQAERDPNMGRNLLLVAAAIVSALLVMWWADGNKPAPSNPATPLGAIMELKAGKS